MSLINVDEFQPRNTLPETTRDAERAQLLCEELERGQILFFKRIPFNLPDDALDFLLAQRHTDSRLHKNISYRPAEDVLRGFAPKQPDDLARMHSVMRDYSAEVTRFVKNLLAPYAGKLALDFASFRPLEEHGRDLSLHKRNDLLHVDAFPTRPTKGSRILRVFININPHDPRIWNVADGFDVLAREFADDAGLRSIAGSAGSPAVSLRRFSTRLARRAGLPVIERSAYDRFMLRFHDYLKENTNFQNNHPKTRLEFPPRSTWIVYTDAVAHAALSGQYALEQTYIIPVSAMVTPHTAPISVLEKLCGQTLSI